MKRLTIFFLLVKLSLSSKEHSFYMYDGFDARIEEAPFIVSLTESNSHICGGILISESIIMSAKHCVVRNGQTLQLAAIAGTRHLSISKWHEHQKRHIGKIVLFDKDLRLNIQNNHDLAILKTVKPFIFKSTVKPIKYSHSIHYNEKAKIFGWGQTRHSHVSSVLQKKDLNLIPRKKCQEMIKTGFKSLKQFEICTNESPCFGDSGGPLVQTIKGEQVLIGVASWTFINCTVPPTIFVYPGYFDAWLKEEIKKLK